MKHNHRSSDSPDLLSQAATMVSSHLLSFCQLSYPCFLPICVHMVYLCLFVQPKYRSMKIAQTMRNKLDLCFMFVLIVGSGNVNPFLFDPGSWVSWSVVFLSFLFSFYYWSNFAILVYRHCTPILLWLFMLNFLRLSSVHPKFWAFSLSCSYQQHEVVKNISLNPCQAMKIWEMWKICTTDVAEMRKSRIWFNSSITLLSPKIT